MSTLIVSGALANKAGNGGGPWERLSWTVGLRKLGFDVHFIEQIAPDACVDAAGTATTFADSVNLAWFQFVTEWFGLSDCSSLVYGGGEESSGVAWDELLDVAASADLLINLSGHLTCPPLVERIRCKAHIDVDPAFTQFWHADPTTSFHLADHDFYFTIGENIGRPECPIPMSGIPWRPIRQPVVLDDWAAKCDRGLDRFTTVASWRGPYGPVQCGGKAYGLKVHEFRKFIELPERIGTPCEIALDIHPADARDLQLLRENGWQLVDPVKVAGSPSAFRRYVQQSGAEFSVAQGIYVETNSGWFSDRSVRYLASGKPVLVQDTGFSRFLPVGEGLLAFHTLDEVVAGAEAIAADYDKHARAARRIAEEYFDSDKVLGKMLEDIGGAR